MFIAVETKYSLVQLQALCIVDEFDASGSIVRSSMFHCLCCMHASHCPL